MTIKAQSIITRAFIEMGAYAPGEIPAAEEIVWGLDKLNSLIDSWATKRSYVYAITFPSGFTLVPGLAPHTIGPTGTAAGAPTFLITGTRPVKIEGINIILNNTNPPVFQPLTPRDKDWWANNRVQTLQNSLPTDYYYEPDFPLGSIYFWPQPGTNYGAQIQLWEQLQGNLQLQTAMSLAPGYEDALIYTLALSMLPAGEKAPNPMLIELARRALAFIIGPNGTPPDMATKDSGMPTVGASGGRRQDFNWLTGRIV